MKPSGVEWLGDVPTEWSVSRLKYRVRSIAQGWSPECENRRAEAGEWGVLKVGCMNSGLYDESENKALPAALQAIVELEVKVGDVLMSRSNTTELVGAVGMVHRTQGRILLCDKLYRITFVENQLAPAYAVYLLRSHSARQQIERDASGASSSMKNISNDRVQDLILPLPPIAEQQALVDFLDHKTAQIDGVIAKKQRMIDLLHEKRQALISEAVTKGLDPDVPTKDSGIKWLGRVPRHWSVERLKYSVTKIEQGWSPQCDNRPADDDEWGVLKVGCGNGNEFDPTEQKALPLDVAPMPEYEIKPGDILMSRGNTRELVGAASLVKSVRPRLMLCDLLYRFHAQPRRADPEFLVFSLRSPHVRFQIEREASGTSASMKKVGQETIRELVLCLPPVDEQKTITARLRPLLDQHDEIVRRIESQIAKLREYRQTLISAAVTGQIDVSKEVA